MYQLSPKRAAFYCYHSILWFLFLSFATLAHARTTDSLPSWNSGPAKTAIVQFVKDVTKKGGPDFVPPAERIATFDNDGTLWSAAADVCPTGFCPRPCCAGRAYTGLRRHGDRVTTREAG